MNNHITKFDPVEFIYAMVNKKIDWEKVNRPSIELIAMSFNEDIKLFFSEGGLFLDYFSKEKCKRFWENKGDSEYNLKEEDRLLMAKIHSLIFFAYSNKDEHINQLKLDL